MNPDFLKLSELIPNDPWEEVDIGMMSDCVVVQCRYCRCSKGDSGRSHHYPACPWPELSSLSKQMRKEFQLKYGTIKHVQNERFKRNRPKIDNDYDDDIPF